jgi:hypothetical protein
MSSPAQDDAARQTTPTPPWAEAARNREEKRRLQEEVSIAAEHLKQEAHELPSVELASPGQRSADDIFEMAKLREGYFELEETRRGIWAPTLGPVVMPLPPQDKGGWLGLGAIIALGSAVGIAAGATFVVMSTLQLPSIGSVMGSIASRDAPPKVQSRAPIVTTAALGGVAQVSSAEAKAPPTELVSPPSSLFTTPQANTDLSARPAAPAASTAIAPVNVASASPEPIAPPTSFAPPARPAVSLARDEVEQLMKRGRYLLAAGDIASARLILTRLANSGEAEAALLLAGTYDAAELAKARIVGAVPDAAKARSWYEKAAEQGSQEARRRLQSASR